MINKVITFFDKFEDRVRGHLSKHPIVYTFIGAIAIVLFWRGVWHTADILQARGGILGWLFYEPVNLVIVVMILLATGLFVSYFIGDSILLSGIKGQKKMTDKTEKEIREEEIGILELRDTVKDMKIEVEDLKNEVEVIHQEHESDHHIDSEKGNNKK